MEHLEKAYVLIDW